MKSKKCLLKKKVKRSMKKNYKGGDVIVPHSKQAVQYNRDRTIGRTFLGFMAILGLGAIGLVGFIVARKAQKK
jgi:hypothetical protein